MKLEEKLKVTLAETYRSMAEREKRDHPNDEPRKSFGCKCGKCMVRLTAEEVAQEIENGTERGMKELKSIMGLTVHMLSRQKITSKCRDKTLK